LNQTKPIHADGELIAFQPTQPQPKKKKNSFASGQVKKQQQLANFGFFLYFSFYIYTCEIFLL